jgi:hypothetical protein
MDAMAQLALMSKANQVFGGSGIFLSFPATIPIAFKPEELNAANAFSDPNVLHKMADFSLTLNSLPTGTLFQGVGDNYLWRAYDQWLTDMVLARDQMTADERAQYDEANALLSVKDANGFLIDSPMVVAYKQYRDGWFSATQNYKNEQITATSSSDPAVQTQWKDVDEPRLRALVDQASSDWENKGHKADVENAQALKARLEARSPSSAWNEWRGALMNEIDMPTDPVSNMPFAPTLFSPADLFAADWLPFHLSSDEIKHLVWSAPDELRNMFYVGDGVSAITSLSFEFRSAALVRPWLDTDVFKARFWKFRDDTPPLSDGAAVPQGSWPAYISAIVFARNIVVTTQNAPQPQYWQAFVVSNANLSANALAATTKVHKTKGTGSGSTVVRDHTTHGTGPRWAAKRWFTSGFASGAVTEKRPVTPTSDTTTAPRTGQLLAVSRLTNATYTSCWLPPRAASGESSGSSSPPPTTTSSDVSILAFICRTLGQTPNPDPSLTW